MKIWCDACNKTEACVFCTADEAALCEDCDMRVHQANKLASKHQRFSLLQPSSSSSHTPQCDICQAKRALLFCQQDRAILCRDCDVSIHTANELTQKHNRFLVTGAKLSSLNSTKNITKSDSAKDGLDPVPDLWPQSLTIKRAFLSASSQASSPQQTNNITITHDVTNQPSCEEGGGCTSSISEYLMQMLPEWQVEDLLDSSLNPSGLYKDSFDDDLLFLNAALESRDCTYAYENEGLWVPQAPTLLQSSPFNSGIFGVNDSEGTKGDMSKKASRKMMDDAFTVPQISPQPLVSKRSRF